jgi:DNA invertase Pin-like site-specific DNA recombinase
MTATTHRARAYSYIRFSAPEQMNGDSFRRQAELSRAYADQHGLDLDEALTFQDLGVSAFRGRNVQDGALGAFVQAVDSGRVPAGSYLLVESLDRLSRDKVQQAFRQFCDILDRGVNVATLTDGKLYTQVSLNENFADLLISLIIMFRAHEESDTKSKRVSAAWQQKRDKAQTEGQKLTGKCPGWLWLDGGRDEFKVIESRAEVVRRIFAMTLAGLNKREIARRLNSEEVPTFGRATSWCESYIRKILDNEAVVGTFQPMRIEIGSDGRRRRVPDGDPIENYFPPVVSQENFLRVKQLAPSGVSSEEVGRVPRSRTCSPASRYVAPAAGRCLSSTRAAATRTSYVETRNMVGAVAVIAHGSTGMLSSSY